MIDSKMIHAGVVNEPIRLHAATDLQKTGCKTWMAVNLS